MAAPTEDAAPATPPRQRMHGSFRFACGIGAAVALGVILTVLGVMGVLTGRSSASKELASQPVQPLVSAEPVKTNALPPTHDTTIISQQSQPARTPPTASNKTTGLGSAKSAFLSLLTGKKQQASGTTAAPASKQSQPPPLSLSLAPANEAAGTDPAPVSALLTTLLTGGNKQQTSGGLCYAETWAEVKEAVEGSLCGTVVLTSVGEGAYEVDKEAIVTRHVTVTGTPSTMPVIDAREASRAFRVKPGGFLELEYVQMFPSEDDKDYHEERRGRRKRRATQHALMGHRQGQEQAGSGGANQEPIVVRGGAVYFEEGAEGGVFVGVFFVMPTDLEEAVDEAIELTLSQRRVRIYGGFVLAADGQIDFVNCLFWLPEILSPLNDYIQLGGQVLMLGGTVTMTGCMFWEINIFAIENGMGLNVAVLGGAFFANFVDFNEANLAGAFNAIGEAFLVAGGTAVYTGLSFNEWSANLWQTGTGCLTVAMGVQVVTGMNLVEAIGVGAFFGAGMEITVGAGVSIFTGAEILDYNGIYSQASAGEMAFTGAGVVEATGCPLQEYSAICDEHGMGNFMALGAGVVSMTGCTLIDAEAIGTWFGVGEFLGVGAGHFTFWGGYMLDAAAIIGWYGLGIFFYVGGGSLVLGGTGFLHEHELKSPDIEIWVTGGCADEPPEDTPIPYNYGLPYFITTYVGCDHARLGGRFLPSHGHEAVVPSFAAVATKAEKHVRMAATSAPGGVLQLTDIMQRSKESEIYVRNVHHSGFDGGALDKLRISEASKMVLHDLVSEARKLRLTLERRRLQMAMDGTWKQEQEAETRPESVGTTSVASAPVQKSKVKNSRRRARRSLQEVSTEAAGPTPVVTPVIATTNVSATPRTDQPHSFIHIDKLSTAGTCELYLEPDMVTGAGASTCVIHDAASDGALLKRDEDDDMTPPLVKQLLGSGDDTNAPLRFTPHYIFSADLILTARPESVVNRTVIERVLSEVVTDWQTEQDLIDDETIYVHVYDASPALPKEAASFLYNMGRKKLARSLFETNEYSTTHHYKVAITSTHKGTGALLQGNLETLGEELIEALNNRAFDYGQTDDVVGHLDISFDRTLVAPAYTQADMGQGRVRHLGAHTIAVVDPESPALPTSHVTLDKEYLIHIEQSHPEARLTVELVTHTAADGEWVVSTFEPVLVDGHGNAQWRHVFSDVPELKEAALADQDFYLKVRSEGVLAHSLAFTLSSQHRTRKLYGPSVYM